MVRTLKTFMKFVNALCEYATALMLAVMTLSILLQVTARAFGHGFDWTEELARMLQIAMVLLGTGICTYYGSNIAIETVIQRARGAWRRGLMIAIDLLSLLLFEEMVRYGLVALKITGRQTSPGMGISMSLPYAFILAGCAITFLHILVHLLELTFDWRAMDARLNAAGKTESA